MPKFTLEVELNDDKYCNGCTLLDVMSSRCKILNALSPMKLLSIDMFKEVKQSKDPTQIKFIRVNSCPLQPVKPPQTCENCKVDKQRNPLCMYCKRVSPDLYEPHEKE